MWEHLSLAFVPVFGFNCSTGARLELNIMFWKNRQYKIENASYKTKNVNNVKIYFYSFIFMQLTDEIFDHVDDASEEDIDEHQEIRNLEAQSSCR